MSATNTDDRDRELHRALLSLQDQILDQQQETRELARTLIDAGQNDEAQRLMDSAIAIEQEYRAVVKAADDYFGGVAVTADGSGDDTDMSANSAGDQLRIGPLGSTTDVARHESTGGGANGNANDGTMRGWKRAEGDISANQAGDDGSAGTLADYKERQAKADARPVRIVDESDLSANSLTAAREREAAETIHVVGTLASDDAGRLKTNATGTGSGTVESLRSGATAQADPGAERVRITDAPGADPVVISHVNTAGEGGTMADYRARRDAKDVVVVNPDALPTGAI